MASTSSSITNSPSPANSRGTEGMAQQIQPVQPSAATFLSPQTDAAPAGEWPPPSAMGGGHAYHAPPSDHHGVQDDQFNWIKDEDEQHLGIRDETSHIAPENSYPAGHHVADLNMISHPSTYLYNYPNQHTSSYIPMHSQQLPNPGSPGTPNGAAAGQNGVFGFVPGLNPVAFGANNPMLNYSNSPVTIHAPSRMPDAFPAQPQHRTSGGRPRDKIWELFDGTRDFAKCRYCTWKTDHPKAFRMRAHVLSCDGVPESDREKIKTFLAASSNTGVSAQLKKKTQSPSSMTTPAASASAVPPIASSSGNKKPREYSSRSNSQSPISRTTANMSHQTSNQTLSSAGNPSRSSAPLRSPITCHVLDSISGKPASDMKLRLDRLGTEGLFTLLSTNVTDSDGRCNTLLTAGSTVERGIYKLTYFTGDYFTRKGIASFYPFCEITFEIKVPSEHHHIPLLLSPYSYSTYRGS